MRTCSVYFFTGHPKKEEVLEICLQTIMVIFQLGYSFLPDTWQISVEKNGNVEVDPKRALKVIRYII